jgi:N-acyl-D-amino-acid deacylase
MVVDGTGRKAFRADVRVRGERIAAIGSLRPDANETTLDLNGLTVAPGFIDAHSHADGGLDLPIDPLTDAGTMLRQGVTTAVVGQDGGSNFPLKEWFAKREVRPAAIHYASFVGHGSIRREVLGSDFKRPATPAEIRTMRTLVAREMQSGALGLSTGLEYEPGLYATTEEVVALAEVAGIYGGIYISHVRDEENNALTAFEEVITIGEKAHLPVHISHIKLGSAPVWGKARQVLGKMTQARKRGIDVTADVYPYTFWQSGLPTLVPSDKNHDTSAWKSALAEIGGAARVYLSNAPVSEWKDKTLAEVARLTGRDAVSLAQEIATKPHSVIVTAMQESDLKVFLAEPTIMLCSDGGLRGGHPRGAGSYPRLFGRYVREQRVLSLEQAVRKCTSVPAARFGFAECGVVAVGKRADLVLFDPRAIEDTATVATPQSPPLGIQTVFVNGVRVLHNGAISGERPGKVLRRGILSA